MSVYQIEDEKAGKFVENFPLENRIHARPSSQ